MQRKKPAAQLVDVASWVARNKVSWQSPLLLMHAVTEACNARCPYCVFRHGRPAPDELSVPEIGAIYQEARALGARYLHLWGGEPLVHRQIGEVLREAREARLIVGMVTNGHLLARRAAAIARWIDRLYVSVDHPSPKHDEMRRTPGLFQRLVDGVREIREHRPKLPVIFNLTLCRDNAGAMDEMASLCRDLRVGLYVAPMRETANADEADGEGFAAVENGLRALDWEEQRPVWARLLELRREGLPVQNSASYLKELAAGGPPSYRCHWPKLALGLEANGDVVDCQDWTRPIGNVRRQTLREIVGLPRMRELRGACGESCNTCASPARVEPSRFWGMRPGVLTGAVQRLALRRQVR